MTDRAALLDRVAANTSGRLALVVGRIALGAVFAFAAVPKLLDPAAFARDIENYRMLSPELVVITAVTLPALELVIALALITGVHARGAAVIGALLLAAFAGGMLQAIVRGIDLECGCFGAAAAVEVSGWTIARNVLLALLGVSVASAPDVGVLRRAAAVEPTEPAPTA